MTDGEMDEVIRLMESGMSHADAMADVRGDAMALINELLGRNGGVGP